MAITTTADLAPLVQAYYDKRFLLMAKPIMVLDQFAQKRVLPGGSGKTVRFVRYQPLPVNKTPLTETADGGIINKAIKTTEIEATVAPYGDVVEISDIASKTAIDQGVKEKVNIIALQAAETINSLISDVVAKGFMRRRADADANYQKDSIATSAGTTTTLIDTARTEANDYWNGGYITFTNPEDMNYGITVQVNDFGSNTLTFASPLPYATSTKSKYRLVVGTGIVATDVLTSTAIRQAVKDLKKNKALPFADGKYVAIVDPDVEYDFMSDDTWVKAAQYSNVKALYEGEIGEWFGVRFVASTSVYRETVAGVANENGDVHVITVVGQEAYGVVDLDNGQKKIYVKTGKELGQAIEMTSTVGWKVIFTSKVLNGCFGVNILCGASK